MSPERRPHILPGIIAAQFLGTSLWFVGNAVAPDVASLWPGVGGAVAWLTSAVQLGFIAGTLVYAALGLADRFPAHRVFATSSAAGAAFNALVLLAPESFETFLTLRFMTGFALAGIYPVGMKLAASWYRAGLGRAIGFLVGALVVGTAFPHLLRMTALPWRPVILASSGMAILAAMVVGVFVPEGPNVKRSTGFSPVRALCVFAQPRFLRAALGYFGHMWELYAFWAFVPLAVATVLGGGASVETTSKWSFAIIGAGAIGCVVGGWVSLRRGSAVVAAVQMAVSGLLCLASPWLLGAAPPALALALLIVWGIVVVGDSPQFSALGARTAPPDLVGTGLTLMNAVGFAITIGSIQLLGLLSRTIDPTWIFVVLGPGPLLGAIAMRSLMTWERASLGGAGTTRGAPLRTR